MHPMCLLILAVKQMVVMNTPKAQEMSMLNFAWSCEMSNMDHQI